MVSGREGVLGREGMSQKPSRQGRQLCFMQAQLPQESPVWGRPGTVTQRDFEVTLEISKTGVWVREPLLCFIHSKPLLSYQKP